MYTLNLPTERCEECVYYRYDTSSDEIWCSHRPLPFGIGERCIVERAGRCEFFEPMGD